MENNILVSICCLTYNHEDYLRDTLEGFLMQKVNFPIEILINDDASTDSTSEIVREYADKYPELIRPFYQPVNLYSQGKDLCLEVLYPQARGKYIALCEGDDYWTDPMKLQRQVDFLEAHPEYSACVHNTMLHYCSGNGKDRPLLPHTEDCDVRFEDICNGMSFSFHTSSIVAKKSIIANPQDFFYVGLSYGFGDHPDALWMYVNGPIRCLKECMSVYRIHSGSASWSAAVDGQYDKLREFIIGKCELLRAFRPWAPKDQLDVVDQAILEKEFELMYIEGRDADQRKPPYDEILAQKPFSYRFKNRLKCLFPGVQRVYRRQRGYVSVKESSLPVLPLSAENLAKRQDQETYVGKTVSDQCLVSILCTAYNHEAFLRDALDGFVNQRTRFPFEVLVNDDVSTDSTRDMYISGAYTYSFANMPRNTPTSSVPSIRKRTSIPSISTSIRSSSTPTPAADTSPSARGTITGPIPRSCSGRWTISRSIRTTPPAYTIRCFISVRTGTMNCCSTATRAASALSISCPACPALIIPARLWASARSWPTRRTSTRSPANMISATTPTPSGCA